ncbi:MAG: amidohydrolase [Chloroflexi bacterium]|nr:amidohydrolase [Chloroflexota bacterium]
MIIDAHMHIHSPTFISARLRMFYARAAAYRSLPFRDPEALFPRTTKAIADPEGTYTIGEMDAHGVDIMVPMIVDHAIHVGEEAEIPFPKVVEHYAELMQRYKGRLYAFIGVDPRRPGGLELFERAVKEWGFRGLKLYPGNGYYPYDEVCTPFYKKCLELGVPVTFHTSPTPAPATSRFARPMNLSDLHGEYPDLTIIYAHAGHGAWWEEAAQVASGHPHGYLDLSQWPRDARKDLGGFIQKLGVMRDYVGAHRILWASDFGFGPSTSGDRSPLPHWLKTFKDLPATAEQYGVKFTQEEVDLMLGGNAQRILNLQPPA